MKVKQILLVAFLSFVGFLQSQAQILSDLGSTATNLFSIEGNATVDWNPIQTPLGISINGTDGGGNQFGGFWASPWTLTSNTGLTINITGSIPDPGSLFTVTFLEHNSYETKEFEGSFAESGVIGNNYTLIFQTETNPFASIGGMTFTSGGSGVSLDISVNNFSVVPEPSTNALILLGGLFLLFASRFRKAQD